MRCAWVQFEIEAEHMDCKAGTLSFYDDEFVEDDIVAVFGDFDYAYEEGTKIKIIQTKKTDDSYDGEIDFVYEKPYDEMADYERE